MKKQTKAVYLILVSSNQMPVQRRGHEKPLKGTRQCAQARPLVLALDLTHKLSSQKELSPRMGLHCPKLIGKYIKTGAWDVLPRDPETGLEEATPKSQTGEGNAENSA